MAKKYEPVYYKKKTAQERKSWYKGKSIKKVKGDFEFSSKGKSIKRKTGWKVVGGRF